MSFLPFETFVLTNFLFGLIYLLCVDVHLEAVFFTDADHTAHVSFRSFFTFEIFDFTFFSNFYSFAVVRDRILVEVHVHSVEVGVEGEADVELEAVHVYFADVDQVVYDFLDLVRFEDYGITYVGVPKRTFYV